MSLICLMNGLEVNYPCSSTCSLFGDCCVAFEMQRKSRAVTNADRIRSMSDEALAEFLEHIAYDSEPVWLEPFDKAFCQTCSSPEPCVVVRECPNGISSLWWLKQPAKEERHGTE